MPASASVCPSPLIVSNGAENLSAILRAFIQELSDHICVPQTVNRMVKQYSSGVSVADRDELAIIHKIQVNRTVPSQN